MLTSADYADTGVPMSGTRIAVIGTAGREGLHRLSPPVYRGAYARLGEIVMALPKPWCLQSGGAAWMDHLAVLAFLNRGSQEMTLDLHLPCPWVPARNAFQDSGERDWRVNPGGTVNYYHKLFSGMMRSNTLADIEAARQSGARLHVHGGFFERNAAVADADVVIAFTWAPGGEPLPGGTAHTWNLARKNGVKNMTHVSLLELVS